MSRHTPSKFWCRTFPPPHSREVSHALHCATKGRLLFRNSLQAGVFLVRRSVIAKEVFWRQIWRVTGRESGSPELLGSPRTSPEVPRTSPEVFGDFPGSSLTVELNCNPELPRKFPKLPRKLPGLPRKFRDSPGGQPLSLGSLTPSPPVKYF